MRETSGGYGASEVVDQEIMETYLTLINSLSLLDTEQAWILTRPLPKTAFVFAAPPKLKIGQAQINAGKGMGAQEKRKVVTLADVRKAWQDELDHRADMRAGRFPILSSGGLANGNPSNGVATGAESMEVDVFA